MKFFLILTIILIAYYLLKAFFRLIRLIFNISSTFSNHEYSYQKKNDVIIEGKPRRMKLRFKEKAEIVDYEELDKT